MSILALLAGLAFPPPDSVRIVLVATTDLHGHVTDWDYLRNAPWDGGLARAATVIDSLRLRYPEQVVLVDAGGATSGGPLAAYYGTETARDPHPVIEAMNLLGYDAATPGDRDFDFGPDRFNRAVAGATFSWVSGNLRVLPADTLAFAPYRVIQRGGARIAVTGFTTPGAMVWNGGRIRGRFRVNRIETTFEPILREMRQDADILIVLAHTGFDGPSAYDTTGVGAQHVARRLAGSTVRPDVVVVGHSGQEMADSVVSGVHFVQPRPDGGSLAIVHITLVPRGGQLAVTRIRGERIPLQDVRPAGRVLRRMAEPHAAVLRWVATPVGEVDQRFSAQAARIEDTPLMRFFHQAMRRATGAELSAAPVYDVRSGLDAGEVTMGELFRLYPYEHTVRSIRVSGAQLKAYLEQCARYFFVDTTGRVFTNRYMPADRYDVLGGAAYAIDLSQPTGSRISRLMVGARAVTPTDSFTLALSDSRQQGHGGFAMLTGSPVVSNTGVTVRQALVAAFARVRSVSHATYEGQDWQIAPPEMARRARALFVRQAEREPAVDSAPAPAVALPLAPSRAELRARDSLLREQDRADSIARVVVATLRLPAEAGPRGGLARLLADAYRNALRADVAIVLMSETGDRLPARGLTAAEIAAAAPGDATLLSIRMTGEALGQLLENALAADSPCCEFSGIEVEYDPRGSPWDRVRRIRVKTTGKELDRRKSYLVALSSRNIQDDRFSLASTDCRPSKGCRTAGTLAQFTVERTAQQPAEALRDYLRHLPQPVVPPGDSRLIPKR